MAVELVVLAIGGLVIVGVLVAVLVVVLLRGHQGRTPTRALLRMTHVPIPKGSLRPPSAQVVLTNTATICAADRVVVSLPYESPERQQMAIPHAIAAGQSVTLQTRWPRLMTRKEVRDSGGRLPQWADADITVSWMDGEGSHTFTQPFPYSYTWGLERNITGGAG